MEGQLTQNRASLKNKIPEIKRTLEAVQHLKTKKDSKEKLQTHFELSDNLYANATIEPSTVYLWLGANVMLEYSFDEAIDLLTKNLENAEKSLFTLEDDLQFLKDQITTTEVQIARIYNFDVKQRRLIKQRQTAPVSTK